MAGSKTLVSLGLRTPHLCHQVTMDRHPGDPRDTAPRHAKESLLTPTARRHSQPRRWPNGRNASGRLHGRKARCQGNINKMLPSCGMMMILGDLQRLAMAPPRKRCRHVGGIGGSRQWHPTSRLGQRPISGFNWRLRQLNTKIDEMKSQGYLQARGLVPRTQQIHQGCTAGRGPFRPVMFRGRRPWRFSTPGWRGRHTAGQARRDE